MPAELRTFVVGPIQTNCYVFTDTSETGSETIVIDPGSQGGEIARLLAGDNVKQVSLFEFDFQRLDERN